MVLLTKIYILLIGSFFCCAVAASAQNQLPRYGQDFTFGIIEGPERLVGTTLPTHISLTVMSASNGVGNFSSPSGVTGTFTFTAGTPARIDLPNSLIHLDDLGKTNKGILVHTSVPVNLVLWD